MDTIKRCILTIGRIAVCFGAAALLALFLSSCASDGSADRGGLDSPAASDQGEPANAEGARSSIDDAASRETIDDGSEAEIETVRIAAEGFQAEIVLDDTDAARAFAGRMPFDLEMHDMNGNEKYGYLGEALPVDATAPGRIEAGDVMLYGDDCVVVFYESFDTSYHYTRLGHIDDPSAVAAIADVSSVLVSFDVS